MNIALMAHDRKKELMVQFCIAYCGILAEHSLCATHVTGKLVSEATELPITLISHGTLIRENLAASGRTRAWVEQTLQNYNCRVRDVLLLTAERSGKLYLAIRKEAAS